MRLNFTNEGGIAGTNRLLKNITGLWLFQRLRDELAPEADLGRPLSVVGLRSLSLRHMVGAVGQALGRGGGAEPGGERLGGIGNSAATAHFRDLPAVTVVGHRPFPFQMDGESCGWVDRLEIKHRPDALSVVVPAPAGGS